LIKRKEQGPIAMRRGDLGNRAGAILVQERKALELHSGLDSVAQDLETVAERHSKWAIAITKNLWLVCIAGNSSSMHPRSIIKECIQEVVACFVTTKRQECEEYNNPSAATTLTIKIKRLYSTGILWTHTFAGLVHADYYCMKK
jgi:hypothetical protein